MKLRSPECWFFNLDSCDSEKHQHMCRALSYLLILRLVWLGVVRWTSVPVSAQTGEKMQASHNQQEDTHAQGGMSTAGAHAAVLDSERRPITAGGFVDSGPVVF
jgi:hypothetical protein